MLTLSDKLEYLRSCRFFETLPYDALKSIAVTSREILCRRDEVLFHRGDEGFEACVILEGEAMAFRTTAQGEEVVLSRFKKGDVFGEFAILSNIPRTASVRVTEDMKVLRIEKEIFLEILRDYPEMAIRVMDMLVQTIARVENRLMDSIGRAGEKK